MGVRAYVDADPVRTHVEALLAAGVTTNQIAALAGVHRTQIRHLTRGQRGRPPAKRLRPATAAALLAVRADPAQPALGATCDALGTRRRLQALMADGWPAQELARMLGAGPSSRLQIARRARVRSATALAVRDLYARLADTPGPSPWCRAVYRARGWLPPVWWDEDTIDDPAYTPPGQPMRAHRQPRRSNP